jgi:hypothetical protein
LTDISKVAPVASAVIACSGVGMVCATVTGIAVCNVDDCAGAGMVSATLIWNVATPPDAVRVAYVQTA